MPPKTVVLKTASDRLAWRQSHNSQSYVADAQFWREQVALVAADKGQTTSDVERLQDVIERRKLDWQQFEDDVEVARLFATDEVIAFTDTARADADADVLGKQLEELSTLVRDLDERFRAAKHQHFLVLRDF